MNGIETITRRIGAETQTEIDGILTEARAEADRIAAGWQAQAEQEAADRRTRNEKAAAQQEERLVSVAQMEARKVLLAAKQTMVDRAFAQAMEKLCSLPDEPYTAAAAKLLVKAVPKGCGEVIFSAADRERIGAAAVAEANRQLGEAGHLTLSEQTRDIRGGFLVADGKVEINCTFETLVRLARGSLSGEVAKLLFPEA